MFLEPTMSVLPVLLLIGSASAQCLISNDNPTVMDPTAKAALTDARFGFSLDALKKTALIQRSENIFFSPHSLHQALTLAYFGARGTTETSLRKALHVPDNLSKLDVQRYYALENSIKQYRDAQANGTQAYEYRSANRLWMTDKKKLRECMFDFFGDQLVKTDFHSNPSAVRDHINDWVSNMTKGHIRDILPPDSITSDTELVLANAVYFKGLWHSRFDAAATSKDVFYISGSQAGVTNFMHKNGSFNYVVSEELGAHILELPYKGEEVSMFILLPPFATARNLGATGVDLDGIRQLVERISTEKGSELLREIMDVGAPPRDVIISLPRFQLEKELPLFALLRSLGASELTSPTQADLRGFVADGEKTLHLGDAVHRARIEVTEDGTTAAGATVLFHSRMGRPSGPAIFNANHPFIYLIYSKPLHTILFSGVYRKPDGTDVPSA